jgi:hypothetical protein
VKWPSRSSRKRDGDKPVTDVPKLPADVEAVLELAKKSREELQKKLDENSFAESIRESLKE